MVTAPENDRFFAFPASSPLTLGPNPPTALQPGHSLVPYPAPPFSSGGGFSRGGGLFSSGGGEHGSGGGGEFSGGGNAFFAPGLGGQSSVSVASWQSAGPCGAGQPASSFRAAAAPTHHGRLWTAGTLRPPSEV